MTRPIRFLSSSLQSRSSEQNTRIGENCQIGTPAPGKRIVLTALFFGLAIVGLMANDLFEAGTDAFLYNRPQEAIEIFEEVVEKDPVNGEAYLYLAMSYEQLDLNERAITTLRRAESVPGIDRGTVRFNIGNNLLKMGQVDQAIDAYGSAIEIDPFGHAAFLNRANAYVRTQQYQAALSDYRTVLGLEPQHQQRPRIEQMISLLERELEAARIAAEEERRRAEEAEERRKALLDNVMNSIESAKDDTENMSAGSEEIDTYDEEFDIADD